MDRERETDSSGSSREASPSSSASSVLGNELTQRRMHQAAAIDEEESIIHEVESIEQVPMTLSSLQPESFQEFEQRRRQQKKKKKKKIEVTEKASLGKDAVFALSQEHHHHHLQGESDRAGGHGSSADIAYDHNLTELLLVEYECARVGEDHFDSVPNNRSIRLPPPVKVREVEHRYYELNNKQKKDEDSLGSGKRAAAVASQEMIHRVDRVRTLLDGKQRSMLDMKKEGNREEIDKHSAARDQREAADAQSSFRGTTLSEQLKKIDLSKQGGTLKICDRSICDSGCEALLRVIKNNEKLTELDLSGCNIYKGNDLAQIVRSATFLKRLSLEWNSLGLARTGISALSSAIASNRSLQEVDLRSNRIGPSTAAALAHALRSNFSLTCLDLRWNEIGPGGAAALIGMLQKNHVLTDVRLAGNGIPPSVQMQIDKLLEQNRVHKPMIAVPLSQHEASTLSPTTGAEIDEVNLERICSLQKEIGSLRQELAIFFGLLLLLVLDSFPWGCADFSQASTKAELHEVQLQKAAADSQLETSRVELKEENLLRKYVEKETGETQLQLNRAKQQIIDLQEKMFANENVATMRLSAVNAELMDARERERRAQMGEAESSKECRHLKDQLSRLQEDNTARVQAAEERARSDAEYSSSIIRRLQTDLAQHDQKHAGEVEAMQKKFSMELRALESAKNEAVQEAEKHKSVAMAFDARIANREQALLQEKEAAQQVLNGKISALKSDIATLQSQLEAKDKEITKARKKFAASTEEYENQIARQTTAVTRSEFAKASAEEKLVMMIGEQGKAQEKIKSAEDRVRQIEQKMEADKFCYSEAIAKELAKHLEDQKKLETEVITTRKQIDAMHLQVREIQAEQERRKLDAEKCVTGAETAVLEWIHQQFASLRSTLTIQHSLGGTGFDLQGIPKNKPVHQAQFSQKQLFPKAAEAVQPQRIVMAPLKFASFGKTDILSDAATIEEELVSCDMANSYMD
ncbi:unnamed protein product [Sphagnum tenellum]